MKAIELLTVGQANAKPATVIPVPSGIDPTVFLAMLIDEYMSDGYRVASSYRAPNTVVMCKLGGVIDTPVFKVALVDMVAVEAKQAS